MSYQFTIMSQEQAEEIAYQWKYDGEYAFYDMTADEEDLSEFLDDKLRGHTTYSVHHEGEMMGFFTYHESPKGTVDIGLGMKPSLTGNGGGMAFAKAGMDFAGTLYDVAYFTLSVAAFNKRAIKVYTKLGFEPQHHFSQQTNGGNYEFIKMILTVGKGGHQHEHHHPKRIYP
ncbi:GNAT family N-acetyltransferase [Bacillus sp. KH172YL63]|uniref:GNAT family N-acetyltransferase n=1 Tax=Bacillus sp. KH172YL63 TaxID=2709784 RepID=UPI0013E47983|nr:GNAT family protein [Bacillus sp. KH172YL63]BCB03587.1 N-acetyltransferase [Bacillus sp. KH172YL63]